MNILEIGIEKECFLLRDNEILEPIKYGFPKDEFEFLVELRSLPADRFYPVYTTLMAEEIQNSLRANKFNMELSNQPSKLVTQEWVDNHWIKHNLHRFDDEDHTENIYGKPTHSHHLGVLPVSTTDCKLTAGIHVHFSSRNSKTGEVIKLPIEKIVKEMDTSFSEDIQIEGRNMGEWEPKPHGFEYRSLPANSDLYWVIKEAFRILRKYG